MGRPKGTPQPQNRDLIKDAARMHRAGMPATKIAEFLRREHGSKTHTRTVEKWIAGGILTLDVDSPRSVLESLLDDPSPRIRLDAAKILYALEEATSAETSTPAHDAVIYAEAADQPPEGLERPCAVLTVYS